MKMTARFAQNCALNKTILVHYGLAHDQAGIIQKRANPMFPIAENKGHHYSNANRRTASCAPSGRRAMNVLHVPGERNTHIAGGAA